MNIKPQPALVSCVCLKVLDTGVLPGMPPAVEKAAAAEARRLFDEAVQAVTTNMLTVVAEQSHRWCPAGAARIFATAFGRILAASAVPLSVDRRSTFHDRVTDEQWDELVEFARAELDRATIQMNKDPENG